MSARVVSVIHNGVGEQGRVYRHHWLDNEDGTVTEIWLVEGNPLGEWHEIRYINGVPQAPVLGNGVSVPQVSMKPREIGPSEPGFFEDWSGFVSDPLDWAFGGGGQQAHLINYDNVFYAGFVGEGVRGIVGDEYLANAGGWELVGVTTGVVTAGVLSGWGAGVGFTALGTSALTASVGGGAVGGAVEYASWQGLARVGSKFNDGGEVAAFSAQQMALHAAAGAVGGGVGHIAANATGTGLRAAAGKFAKPKVVHTPSGIVYKRTDLAGKLEPYVGQAKHDLRYIERQAEHARKFPDSDFHFDILDRAHPGVDLDIAEHNALQNLTNGVKASRSPNVSNMRDPVGELRRKLLGLPEPKDF